MTATPRTSNRLRSRVLFVLGLLLFVGVPFLFLLSPPGSRPPPSRGIDWLYDGLVTIAGEPVARVAWGILCIVLAASMLMSLRPRAPTSEHTDDEALDAYIGELPPHETTVEPWPNQRPNDPGP